MRPRLDREEQRDNRKRETEHGERAADPDRVDQELGDDGTDGDAHEPDQLGAGDNAAEPSQVIDPGVEREEGDVDQRVGHPDERHREVRQHTSSAQRQKAQRRAESAECNGERTSQAMAMDDHERRCAPGDAAQPERCPQPTDRATVEVEHTECHDHHQHAECTSDECLQEQEHEHRRWPRRSHNSLRHVAHELHRSRRR